MDKCFWKKALSVIFGFSLVSFLATGLSSIINLIIVEDRISEDIAPIKDLVESNATIFIILAYLLEPALLSTTFRGHSKQNALISSGSTTSMLHFPSRLLSLSSNKHVKSPFNNLEFSILRFTKS